LSLTEFFDIRCRSLIHATSRNPRDFATRVSAWVPIGKGLSGE